MTTPNDNSFRQAIFDLLSEGQHLSVGEKMLVNQEIRKFTEDFKSVTSRDPTPLFGTIYLIAPKLEAFGFKLPRVDKWREEDMRDMENYAHRAGIKKLRKRKALEVLFPSLAFHFSPLNP